jgi:aspartate beta-hydroxylase
MEPGTVVEPHTGITNARIRIHLALFIPDGARIRIAGEERTWVEGKCLVIDDSYVHEVWHHGTEKRIVLIVDIWHPELSLAQREATIDDPNALKV